MECPLNICMPLCSSLIITDDFNSASSEQQLNIMQLIYMRTLEALNVLKEKNLRQLYALVGDQACQIRALKFALLNSDAFESEKNAIQSSLEKIKKIKEDLLDKKNLEKEELRQVACSKIAIRQQFEKKIELNPTEKKKLNLQCSQEMKKYLDQSNDIKASYIKKYAELTGKLIQDDVLVSQDLLFLTRGYILKKIVKNAPTESNEYKRTTKSKLMLVKELDCGSIFSDQCFNLMKNAISQQSVNFVKELANEIQFSKVSLLEPKCVKDRRMELPFYYMTRVIFEFAVKKNIPILLKIKNIKEKTFACQVSLPEKLNPKSVGIVVEADSSALPAELKSDAFKKKLLEEGQGILGIISYNAAQHPSYTDENLDVLDEFQANIKKEAEIKGFSSKNLSLCCIRHVYSDSIGDQLKGATL